MSLTCKPCGSRVPEGARFCPECGSSTSPQPIKTTIDQQVPVSVVNTTPRIGIDFPTPDSYNKQITATSPAPDSAMSNLQTAPVTNTMSSRFARFWALGELGPFSCWTFSNNSQQEAQQLANGRAFQISEKYRKEKTPPQQYLYSDRTLLREPIIQEIHNSVISRNAYGCLILNTADVMFVDIDFPETKRPGLLKKIFKGPEIDFHEETLSKIESWTSQNSEWGWRVYRTFAGFRLLATNGLFSPESAEVHAVFEGLGSDPLYQLLCKVQKCFRARLTPKPWRCKMAAPNVRWPWASEKKSQEFNKWQQKYDVLSKNFATCRLVKKIGNPIVHPSVQPIIELHDRLTFVGTDLPLA